MKLHLWMEDALCRRVDNSFWYPPLDAPNQESYYAIGRELCHRCPVWSDCLTTGTNETWGMWGGLTPQERHATLPNTTKTNALRSHGSWIRYRQGCRCSDCVGAHDKPLNSINTSVLPSWNEPVDDLELLRFSLLQDDKPVH